MTTVHNNRKSNLPGFLSLSTLGLVCLLMLVAASTFFAAIGSRKGAQADSSFSFTAAGDYGQTNSTTANLNYIAGSGASFNLALGDLNYDPATVSADVWSSYVKGHLPANFPFEIVVGEHDTAQIDALAADLPDQVGTISGTYAKEYYFDYPPGNPLARFIMVSPGGLVSGYQYTQGSPHYKWVASTIDNARAANIPWVIVGMHKYCIVVRSDHLDACAGQDLLNLLIGKKVDLILQGQKHGYQASKQLTLNGTTCASLAVGSYNASCVVDDTTSLTKGAGSVIDITGTGGKSLATIDTSDPQAGYFRTWMGGDVNPTWGVSRFTVSATQLTAQFVPVSGGTFSDGFTITSSAPTPTPSPSVPATPSPSPGTVLAQDSFQRADQSLWGTASDGQVWTGDANSLPNFSISGNTGQVVGTTGSSYNAILGPTAANAEVVFTGSLSDLSNNNLGAVLRWTDANNWYKAYIDGTNLVIQMNVNGTLTTLARAPFAATALTSYTLRFNVVGTALSAKVWPAGMVEPDSWMATAADSTFSSGYCGLRMLVQNGVTAQHTWFQATTQ